MNAGELHKEIAKRSRAFVARTAWGGALSAIGVWLVFFAFYLNPQPKYPLINGSAGALMFIIGLFFLFSAKTSSITPLEKTLTEYREKWQHFTWTKENLEKKIGLFVPDNNPDMARYAFSLVSEAGVGPYPPQALFSIIHSAKMYELERSLTLGMIDLLGNNHLVRVPSGYGWPKNVQEKFSALHPMPDDFDPKKPDGEHHPGYTD